MRKVPIIELFLSLISTWWAIVLFSNHQMLDRVPKHYEPLAELQENGWGLIFMVAALIKILGIITERFYLRKVGLFMSMFLYGLISAGHILSGQFLATQTGVYFALSVLALYGVREVRHNAFN